MVRLGASQQRLLDGLKDARAGYDREVNQLEADLRVRKNMARFRLSEKVREALDAGIPARQVALKGLGYADVGSLKQFIEPSNPGVATSVEALPVSAVAQPEPEKHEITLGDFDRRGFVQGTDSEGKKFFVYIMPKDGEPDHAYMDNSFRGTSDDDIAQVRVMLFERYPNLKWS